MNTSKHLAAGPGLWGAFCAQRSLLGIVLFFGLFVNLLVLTGPIFALQVYDRVLSSRSEETLVALVILMGFLFLVMGILDHSRKRIAARIGERMVTLMEERIFENLLLHKTPHHSSQPQGFHDLEILRQFFASAIFTALLDLPWLPVFLLGIALFHPALGWLSAFGAFVLIVPGVINLLLHSAGNPQVSEDYQKIKSWEQIAICDPEMTFGIHIKDTIFPKWLSLRMGARKLALAVQDSRTRLVSIAQTFRMFLQSTIIALAAYLVLQDQLTAGAIIASSVLLSRALGPLDLISQNALTLKSQFGAWRRLSIILNETPKPDMHKLALVHGTDIQADQITVFPPGARRAALRMVNFNLCTGQVMGVIGPSGAGKTTLARAIIGNWAVAGGQIRIGGIPIDQTGADNLSSNIGYLPQQIRFLDGTIAQNISRFRSFGDLDTTIRASAKTGAHDMILSLPDGYETLLGPSKPPLPGGLVQRIGLARAVFESPELLLLDEPVNNLDADGIQALQEVICASVADGKSAIIITQRPSVLSSCDTVLVLDAGSQKAFGPAGDVLRNSTIPQHPVQVIPRYGNSA